MGEPEFFASARFSCLSAPPTLYPLFNERLSRAGEWTESLGCMLACKQTSLLPGTHVRTLADVLA